MDMNLSSMMGANLQSLQQTVSMSVAKMAMNGEPAVMSEMISDFTQGQAPQPAPPSVDGLGQHLDVYA